MPRKEIDYSNTIMYKIVCNDLNVKDLYVGHTTEFSKRKYKHKYSCNTEAHHTHNYQVYKIIRANGGWDNWTMVEIEKHPCNDANEARKRERFWLESLKGNINTVIPCRSHKEYYEDNKEYFNECSKNNYYKNHDANLKKCDQYRELNKEKIKAYREANRDEFNRKQREKRAAKKLEQQSTPSI